MNKSSSGWECPRCKRCYSPSIIECYSCNDKYSLAFEICVKYCESFNEGADCLREGCDVVKCMMSKDKVDITKYNNYGTKPEIGKASKT